MNPLPLPAPDANQAFATEVVRRLREAGFQALWAGGCVRDLILGLKPVDYDVATNATPERVMRLFRRTVPVGISFGVVRVLGPPGAAEVEVATFRTDGRYLDGRRPESVVFGSPEEDAARRDFTINGMFFDPLQGTILDFVGGEQDLQHGIVRAIGDPVARFNEDKLRLLRTVRFAARFGFTIEPATRAALVAMAEQVHVVAPERITQELRRILVHASRARGLALIAETGLLGPILPELVPLRSFRQDEPERNGEDLWMHTLKVLDKLPESPTFSLAFAALLHDVGKPLAHQAGAPHPDHAQLGGTIADRLGRDLRLSNSERERIVWLVRHHHDLRHPQALKRASLKTLLATPGADELLTLDRAHAQATATDLAAVEFCERYRREQPDGPLNPPPLLSGEDLVHLGLVPGPQFRRLLDDVREAQLEGLLGNRESAMSWLQAQLAREADRAE